MKKTLSVLVAVIIAALSAMPAFAVVSSPSPTASKEYSIVVHNNEGGSGSYTTKTDKDGKHATIVAHPKNGYEFVKWIINGKYEITEGDLNSKTLKLLLKGNVVATPVFRKIKTGSKTTGSPVVVNRSSTSPKTGDNTVYFAIGLSAAALIIISALGVKLAKSKK